MFKRNKVNLDYKTRSLQRPAEKTRTSSEVMLFEALDIANRRNWKLFAASIVNERIKQHLEVISKWIDLSKDNSLWKNDLYIFKIDNLDHQGDESKPLRSKFDNVLQHVKDEKDKMEQFHIHNSENAPEVSISFDRALRIINDFSSSISILSDSLKDVIEHDLSRLHRRMIVSGNLSNTHIDRTTQLIASLNETNNNKPLHDYAFAALALSGGGVRSASYSLGTLQALSRLGLLRSFDFISAVSGGSWAAGWLLAWAYRHKDGINGVEDELKSSARMECAPIHWVRRHIAYLAPRPGLFSSDSWGLLVAYISNWLPVLTLASLSMLALFQLPHAVSAIAYGIQDDLNWTLPALALLGTSTGVLMCLLRRLTLYYREPSIKDENDPALAKFVCFLTLIVVVIMAALLPLFEKTFFVGDDTALHSSYLGIKSFIKETKIIFTMLFLLNVISIIGASLFASKLGQIFTKFLRRVLSLGNGQLGLLKRHNSSWVKEISALFLSSLLIAIFCVAFFRSIMQLFNTPGLRIAYGPFVILATFATAELFGAIATSRRDVDRAWTSRVGGWMLLTVSGWTILCSFALGLTSLLRDDSVLHVIFSIAIPLALVAATAFWFVLRRTRDLRNAVALAATLALAPLLLPFAAAHLTRNAQGVLLNASTITAHFFVILILLLIISGSINVNRFSLHAIYKQGLVRTFLGASRLSPFNLNISSSSEIASLNESQFKTRNADLRTNIDENDNLSLNTFVFKNGGKNLPIILLNAAVNGISLTDQQGRVPRQWPFTFSQRYSGSPAEGLGYAATKDFYYNESEEGVSLGAAMAVSGAAVSPTSGQLTKPLRAFLLGILNARLGMWTGNPRNLKAVRNTSPPFGGFTLLREMLGLRARFANWIHLSDGGHFENLGIYELVRRGCLRIIAVDASCDPQFDFSDLANLIKRARIDLDVQIYPREVHGNQFAEENKSSSEAESHDIKKSKQEIDLSKIDKTHFSGFTWFDIDYGMGLPRGRLLYVKPSVHNEKQVRPEILNFLKQNPSFPHESTVNQFFTERQMEVYRVLGDSNMDNALVAAIDAKHGDTGLSILIKRSA